MRRTKGSSKFVDEVYKPLVLKIGDQLMGMKYAKKKDYSRGILYKKPFRIRS